MQAFKLNLLIIRKRLPSLSIYLVIFMAISILIAGSGSENVSVPDLFEPVKVKAVLFSEEDTALTRGLKAELEKTVNFIEAKDDQAALTDMLYWGEASYILRIPEGFTNDLLSGKARSLKRTSVNDSAASVYVDMAIEKYLDTTLLYVNHTAGISEDELAVKVAAALDRQVRTSFQEIEQKQDTGYANFFFNYMAYSIQAILILGMGIIVLAYKNPDLKRRNTASPLSMKAQTFGFVMANVCFALGTWLFFVIACFILDVENARRENMIWFILNSLLFTLAASALSYMIGNLIRGENAIDAVSNVVSLGSAFISGVFVPQEFLGQSVLRIARFTPVYWYVLGNNRIAGLRDFTPETLRVVWQPMLVMTGFIALFITVSVIAMKRRRYRY